MPRIRTIKPECWEDPAFEHLSDFAKVVWFNRLTQADDAGRFQASPASVAASIGPTLPPPLRKVRAALAEVASAGLVTLYVARGGSYGCFPSWAKHQKIDRPQPSRYPGPESSNHSTNGSSSDSSSDSPNRSPSRSTTHSTADLDLDLDRDRDRDQDRDRDRSSEDPPDPPRGAVAGPGTRSAPSTDTERTEQPEPVGELAKALLTGRRRKPRRDPASWTPEETAAKAAEVRRALDAEAARKEPAA